MPSWSCCPVSSFNELDSDSFFETQLSQFLYPYLSNSQSSQQNISRGSLHLLRPWKIRLTQNLPTDLSHLFRLCIAPALSLPPSIFANLLRNLEAERHGRSSASRVQQSNCCWETNAAADVATRKTESGGLTSAVELLLRNIHLSQSAQRYQIVYISTSFTNWL